MRNRQKDAANVPFSIFFDLDLFADKIAERVLQNLPGNTEPRPALTIKQAAAELSVSTASVRRMIDEGKIKAGNIGGRQQEFRIHPDEINRILKQL